MAGVGGRADATAEFAIEYAGQIGANDALGRLGLVGNFERYDRLDCGPWQPRGKHRQRGPQIDHLVQRRA